ncbi:MAG: zinc-ribbon domain-containing protein [Candidatus Thorarchaeota archaeon]
MTKMFCRNCGKELDYDSKFCSYCGVGSVNSGSSKAPSYVPTYNQDLTKSNINNYRSNIKLIAVIEIAIGALVLFGSTFLWIIRSQLPRMLTHMEINDPDFWKYWPLAQNFLTIIAVVLTLYGILCIIFGFGLLKYKSYGRIGTMMNAALALFSVPIGTIFGIAALYVLTRNETDELFKNAT